MKIKQAGKIKESSSQNRSNSLSLVVFSLLILAAFAVRFYPAALQSFTDPDHYYHLRQMEYVAQEGAVRQFDGLSNLGRPYTYYPLFHLIGGSIAVLFGMPALWAYAFVSLAVAVLAVFAVYLAARSALLRCEIADASPIASYCALFAACLPIFFFRQTVFTRPDAFAAAIFALGIFFLLKRSIAGMAVLGAFAALLHPYSLVVIGALLAIALLSDFIVSWRTRTAPVFLGDDFCSEKFSVAKAVQSKAVVCLVVFAFGALLAATYYLRLPLSDLSLAHTFQTSSEMQPLDPVAFLQVTGPMLIFALIALLKAFGIPDKLPEHRWVWISVISVISSAGLLGFASRNMVFAAVPIALLAGFGLFEAQKKTEQYAIWVWAICGLAVLASVYCSLAVQGGQYSAPQLSGFSYLASLPDAPVIALWDRGHPLTEISKKQVVVDGYFEFEPQLDQKTLDVEFMFHSVTEGTVVEIAKKYGAGYVFFDNKTWDVFGRDASGFFLSYDAVLNQSSVIEKIFDSGDSEVYTVARHSS
ncbi:MAG: hypothetical protein WC408_04680 [Candidatus Micrarchaeia archaeon]|jgi:hypothetical protein